MKRDMELIRKLVLALEDAPTGFAPDGLSVDGYTSEEIGYHSYLMVDAGLAKGVEVTHSGSSGPEAILLNLTWEGHEFAASARDEKRWRQAMGMIQDKGGSVTLSIVTQLLTTLAKQALGLP